jgi:SAM-dependent methyltransferase
MRTWPRPARRRLANWTQATVVERQRDLPTGADVVFCTEVFEHLPEAETERAIWEIDRVLKVGGRLVVGVPVEIGLPALLKGLFRRARRPDAYDGDWSRIWKAALGRPATDRPLERLGDHLRYHSFHLGFDYRLLRTRLEAKAGPSRLTGSPWPSRPSR